MKPLNLILILLSFFSFSCLFAQKEANIWYFGKGAGIDFNVSPPIALFDSRIITDEGCSTISDSQGNLLFYTDGKTVWNADHAVMPNGRYLGGHASSTQSSVVVAWPGSSNLYIIFTLDAVGWANGLMYSVVDMNLQGGLGDLTSKNIQLYTPSCEKLTAVLHENGRDIWAITHLWNSDEFYTYLITPQGLQTTPFVQKIGAYHGINRFNTQGYMKASPDGTKVAVAINQARKLELFDFDSSTGRLSNLIHLHFNQGKTYGLEFSPNSQLLYLTLYDDIAKTNFLYQLDLSISDPVELLQKAVLLKELPTEDFRDHLVMYGLQLTPDNRIFITRTIGDFVSSIEYPDNHGVAATFVDTALRIDGRASMFGFPNFNQSYFYKKSIITSNGCINSALTCMLSDTLDVDSVKWIFGDPLAGGNNTSSRFFPNFSYQRAGNYTIQATYYVNGNAYEVKKNIQIYPDPFVSLPNDTSICFLDSDSLTIQAQSLQQQFIWSTSDTTSSIKVKATGWVWVEASNLCGLHRDSMYISDKLNLDVDLPPVLQLCENDSFLIDLVANPTVQYLWHDGITTNSRLVREVGWNWVETSTSCDTRRDSIWVEITPLPRVALGNDTTFCQGESLTLDASFLGVSYRWQDGSTEAIYDVDVSGVYEVTLSNQCGTASDQIVVTVDSPPLIDLGIDTTLCLNQTLTLDASFSKSEYLWQDGSTQSTYEVMEAGSYVVILSHPCGEIIDRIQVDFEKCECNLHMPTAFSPNGDNRNDLFHPIYSCPFDYYSLQVFNRWGKLVFETSDPNQSWDGSYRGTQVQEGVYVWHIRYQSPYANNVMLDKGGSITVIR